MRLRDFSRRKMGSSRGGRLRPQARCLPMQGTFSAYFASFGDTSQTMPQTLLIIGSTNRYRVVAQPMTRKVHDFAVSIGNHMRYMIRSHTLSLRVLASLAFYRSFPSFFDVGSYFFYLPCTMRLLISLSFSLFRFSTFLTSCRAFWDTEVILGSIRATSLRQCLALSSSPTFV